MRIIQKKVCLLGDFAVGKTSLIRQFVEGRFDDRYHSTMGVKISRKTIARPYGELNLLVWDLAGGHGFETIKRSSYLLGAAGALIVCDLTRAESLEGLERYAHYMQDLDRNIPLTLVANKVDLESERAISEEDLQEAFRSIGNGEFFLASAKTGEQVELAFAHLAEQIEARA
jgi:small GTP-binding protein